MFIICTKPVLIFIYPLDSCMGFPIYYIAFYRKMQAKLVSFQYKLD